MPTWLDKDGRRVCNDLCQCNLLGNAGFHHLGRLHSNLLLRSEWGSNPSLKCQWSLIRMEYPHEYCNKHTMNDRIAAVLSDVAIRVLARRHGHPVCGRLKLELVKPRKTRRGTLCGVDRHVVNDEVSKFLEQCRERRKDEHLPKRIPWEKRPKRAWEYHQFEVDASRLGMNPVTRTLCRRRSRPSVTLARRR